MKCKREEKISGLFERSGVQGVECMRYVFPVCEREQKANSLNSLLHSLIRNKVFFPFVCSPLIHETLSNTLSSVN